MTLLLSALLVLIAGGAGALAAWRSERTATALGAGGAVAGAALGLVPALQVLAGMPLATLDLPWSVPGGRLALGVDALSAFFLVPIFAIGATSAVYGSAYLRREAGHHSKAAFWFWFDALLAAMAVVVTARNAVLFLVAWEAMALASYFLIVFHHERAEVRRAGWIYLAATQLGTAFLLAFFAALGRASGSLDFASFAARGSGAGALFALALVGFGTKAGLLPFHVWLPEAHPAAPSPVSALLSAVMIKTGIYGIARTLTWLGPPPQSFGVALLALGIASATGGVLLALGQRDLKRFLAYSSVENVGVIAVGLGLGLLGSSVHAPAVAALGLAAALLQVWGHAIIKALLFLSAGSVLQATGGCDVERLGGLLQRMPLSGAAFAVGAAALCALPPFAGFPAEFAALLASFRGIGYGSLLPFSLVAIAGLGMVGGLAAAGAAKAMGIAFLGEPRSPAAAAAREVKRAMAGTCAGLAAASIVFGIASPVVVRAARPAIELIASAEPGLDSALRGLEALLWRVGGFGAGVLATAATLGLVRRALLREREVRVGPTWDCGYAAPTSRMQYTGASLVQPIIRQFETLLGPTRIEAPPVGPFAAPARLDQRAPDPIGERGFAPLFAAVDSLALRLRWLQSGSTHRYVLFLVLATVAIFFWKRG